MEIIRGFNASGELDVVFDTPYGYDDEFDWKIHRRWELEV
jgi:hypothetical protein